MSNDVYKHSGVDIDAANNAKNLISKQARTTFSNKVIGDIGGFGSLYDASGYNDPVIVSHIDNVGTKLRIASALNNYSTVGEDLVNHCANDILTCGALPQFFLDYIGLGHMDANIASSLMDGMVRACKESNCSLIGGETAELPGLYTPNNIDLVGFVVGLVERAELINGASINAGDVVVGIASSGLHTNGYSLVRKIFNLDQDSRILSKYYDQLGSELGEVLLTPHRSYVQLLSPVLSIIKGMAHITGGGLLENPPRILPDNLGIDFDLSSWTIPEIFKLVQVQGNIETSEMFRVFNMGVGMIVVLEQSNLNHFLSVIPESWVIGEVIENRNTQRIKFQ
jgi:phosphoribosylformylglycinamidine cyclo-ligase